MKKVNISMHGIRYESYYFIDSIESYSKYVSELNNRFSVSESEIKTIKTFIGHGHSFLTGVAGVFTGMRDDEEGRKELLLNLKLLHAEVLHNQLTDLLNGNKLAINDKGGYFSIKETDVFTVENCCLHKYTEKDIRLKKWYGGSHYYAKIGSVDVVDDSGNVKWNSESEARMKAEKFLNEMNVN